MRTATTTFVSALVLAASVAVAQQVTWQQLVERGLALHAAHHDEQATDMFQRAYAQSSAPTALGQLALSEQRLGRWLDADAHITTVLATSGDRWVEQNRRRLAGALEVIRAHLGGIQVLGGVSGAVVRIDGRVRATLPMDHPIRAEAGSDVVEVVAAGYYTVTRNVTVTAGDVARETVNLVPLAVAQAAAPPPPTPQAPPTPPPPDEDTPAQPPPAARAAPVTTDPAILAAVRLVAPSVRTCLGGVPPYGFLVVTFGPDGVAVSARVEGGLDGTAIGSCVVQRATGVLYPRSRGPAFTARISLRDVIAAPAARPTRPDSTPGADADANAIAGRAPPTSTPQSPAAPVFLEDFRNIPIGSAPPSWTGDVDGFAVRMGADGHRVFRCFRGNGARFTVPIPPLPPDYRVEITYSRRDFGAGEDGFLRVDLGGLLASFGRSASAFGGLPWSSNNPNSGVPSGAPVTVAIERRGDVVQLLVAGRVVESTRMGTAPSPVRALVFDLRQNGDMGRECSDGFPSIYRVAVLRL